MIYPFPVAESPNKQRKMVVIGENPEAPKECWSIYTDSPEDTFVNRVSKRNNPLRYNIEETYHLLRHRA